MNDVNLEAARLLVLAPHPDDAEIAAFGLYKTVPGSYVVTVTAGNAGPANYCVHASSAEEHYRLKGRLRVFDSITVPALAGVPSDRTFNLGYFDARLQAMHAAPDMPVEEVNSVNTDAFAYRRFNTGEMMPKQRRLATWSNLVDDLVSVIEKTKPTVIATPDPRTDRHHDHQFTSVALAEALSRLDDARPTLLLYTNHGDADYYPYGPAGFESTLVPWCGDRPLELPSVYAHPLDDETMRLKLMALESMHDLRLAPAAQMDLSDATPALYRKGSDGMTCAASPGVVLDANNYMRRAARPHELFVVFDKPGFAEMIEAFLSDL
jgi:LmbE family N-acetylglucosaminyl deacetylase